MGRCEILPFEVSLIKLIFTIIIYVRFALCSFNFRMFAFANVNVSYFITTISEVQMPGTVDYDPEPVAIWACGIVLVEMLTKRVPWKSTFDSDYFIWRTNRARSIRSFCYVSFFVCVHDVVCLLPPSSLLGRTVWNARSLCFIFKNSYRNIYVILWVRDSPRISSGYPVHRCTSWAHSDQWGSGRSA